MAYYRVTAKCGHVGNGKYCIKAFYIKAKNAQEAKEKILKTPRVKKSLNSAIISIRSIDSNNYMCGRYDMILDPYFRCTTDEELAEYVRQGCKLKTYYVSKKIKNKIRNNQKRRESITIFFGVSMRGNMWI